MIFRPTTPSEGMAVRPLRPLAATIFTLFLLAYQRFGEFCLRNVVLRPRPNHEIHVTPPTPEDLEESAPHGDVTEGVTLRVPHSDPEPSQPREPPDPTESKPNSTQKVPRLLMMIERSDMSGLETDDQTLMGDYTKGVVLQIVWSSPELQLPRVPPDRHCHGSNRRHRVPILHVLDTNEQMSRGDDTEGVTLTVPCYAPELQVPRVPPDGLKGHH